MPSPSHARKVRPLLERFERFLPDQLRDDECWEWQGSRDTRGYGQLGAGQGRLLRAHRIAWEAHHAEPVPPGICVCHSCDNPACVNPAHLFLGNHAENMADKAAKRRHSFGSDLPQARLTRSEVEEIRRLHAADDLSQHQLARRFGVGQATVHAIVHRKTWRHVP